MDIDCTICNEHITEPKNMSATRCGHIFHSNCVTLYVKRKTMECPTCCTLISLSTVKKIHPTTIVIKQDNQFNPEQKDSRASKPKKSVRFEDTASSSTLSNELSNYEKQNTELRNNLKKKELEITNLQKQLNECALISQKKIKNSNAYKILVKENKHNTIYIKKLEDDNDALRKKILILENELHTTKKDLENTSSRYTAEKSNLVKINEQLLKENNQVKRDIMLLNANFTNYDSAVISLLLTELNESVVYKNSNLHDSLSLQNRNNDVVNKCNSLINSQSTVLGFIKQEKNGNDMTMKRKLIIKEEADKQLMQGIKTEIKMENTHWSNSTTIEQALDELQESLLLD